MKQRPSFPSPTSDNGRLLRALLASPDARVLNPARKFGMTQNTRASNLRIGHGWHIEPCSEAPTRKGQRRKHGYQLTSVAQINYGRKNLGITLAA